MNVFICETLRNCVKRNAEKNLLVELLNKKKKHLLVYDRNYKVLQLKIELNYCVFQIQSF